MSNDKAGPSSGLPYTGPRNDAARVRKNNFKLSLPRGEYDLKAEKARKRAYDLRLVSPLPRDKEGKPSYVPDTREYAKDDVIGPDISVRSATDKTARQFVRRGNSFADYAAIDESRIKALRLAVAEGRISPETFDRLMSELCGDVAPAPVRERVFVDPRPDSPFKRAGKRARAQAFVVVKKGRGR